MNNPQEMMMVTVTVVIYCFVGLVVGMVAYKKIDDDAAVWIGIFWPVTVTVFAMIAAAKWISGRITKILGWS